MRDDYTKYSVPKVIGYLKDKSAIARQYGDKKKNFNDGKFWVRRYAVLMMFLILKMLKNI